MMPKVSVIVPVYNTSLYLERCLDSIIHQTLPSVEIILVDDGSHDGSEKICREYAARDNRIRLIRQENKGVSAARNAGLEAASGEWIAWADSDDRMEPDMLEYLLRNAMDSGADICICGRYDHHRGKTVLFGRGGKIQMNRKDAMMALLSEDGVDNALYDKLWRRELFRQIRFPEGQTYEDLAVVWRLFDRGERVLFLPEPKYHYFAHEGSITDDSSLKNRMAHFDAALERFHRMVGQWPEAEELLRWRCLTAAVGVWCCCLVNSPEIRREYASKLRRIAAVARSIRGKKAGSGGCGLAGRMVVRLLPYDRVWAYALAWGVGRLYRIRHGRSL